MILSPKRPERSWIHPDTRETAVAQTIGLTVVPCCEAISCPMTVDKTPVEPTEASFDVPKMGYKEMAMKQL